MVVVFVSFDLLFRETNGLGKNGQRNVLGTWQEVGVEGDGRGFRLGLLLRRGRGSRLGLSLACFFGSMIFFKRIPSKSKRRVTVLIAD